MTWRDGNPPVTHRLACDVAGEARTTGFAINRFHRLI